MLTLENVILYKTDHCLHASCLPHAFHVLVAVGRVFSNILFVSQGNIVISYLIFVKNVPCHIYYPSIGM
jgi:hypothetical protein